MQVEYYPSPLKTNYKQIHFVVVVFNHVYVLSVASCEIQNAVLDERDVDANFCF